LLLATCRRKTTAHTACGVSKPFCQTHAHCIIKAGACSSNPRLDRARIHPARSGANALHSFHSGACI
jgi:hypothetical protein